MSTKYTYSISGDFPYQKVDLNRLTQEIGSSSIIIALDYVNTDVDDCDIWFMSTLSSTDQTSLGTVVSVHDGEPLPDTPIPTTGPDGKLMVYESSRPIGTKIYFTSEGDNNDNNYQVGGGQEIVVNHVVNDSTSQVIYMDFNTIENKSYLHEGYIMWSGCSGDCLTLELLPSVTPYTGGSNTMFNLYGGYLITPAGGDGNINVDTTSMVLIERVPSFDTGEYESSAYWDADYNTTTHEFSNIQPNYSGEGKYNMFGYDVILNRFVNRIVLVGQGWLQLQTAESERIPHNIRMKMTAHTKYPDHDWSCSVILVLHRKKTS